MIISRRHRFIFIKTNKTAGTSVEIALSRYCGPDDVITAISEEDERMRADLGYPGAQNHLREIRREGGKGRKGPNKRTTRVAFRNHMPAEKVRARLPEETWNGFFKFAIERNPFDRVISHFHWINQENRFSSVSDYLEQGRHRKLIENGRMLYMIDGRIAVDRILRYENLKEELDAIGAQLGLPGPLELPQAKAGVRKDRRHYREVLSPQDRAIIERDFAFELETFGYSF